MGAEARTPHAFCSSKCLQAEGDGGASQAGCAARRRRKFRALGRRIASFTASTKIMNLRDYFELN